MMAIKTEVQLRDEWGMARYVQAMGDLSRWMIGKQQPYSVEELEALVDVNNDALHLLGAMMLEQSKTT